MILSPFRYICMSERLTWYHWTVLCSKQNFVQTPCHDVQHYLPKDVFAILPFFQTQAELDIMEQEQNHTMDVPYSPSFVLDLINDVDERNWNVIDFVFLPGYNNPTVVVLCQSEQT
ncbi:hypothetical protein BD769DRAFT_614526 [Suillus cothurnatus]|nr:hypothetical protein BD769DRAFT_614526 [Suillus cothurnatus]